MSATNSDPDEVISGEVAETPSGKSLPPELVALAQSGNPGVSLDSLDQQDGDATDEAVADDHVIQDEPPKETEPSGDEPEPQGEAAGGKSGKQWYDDDDRSYASQYGLTDYDLRAFSNRSQFKSAINLLERQARAYASYQQPRQDEQPAGDGGAEEVDGPLDKNGRVNVEWYVKNEYDEGQIALAKAERARQDAIDEIQLERRQERDAAAYANAQRVLTEFHDELDDPKYGGYYGKTRDANGSPIALSPDDAAKRLKVANAYHWITEQANRDRAAQGLGEIVPPFKSVSDQARRYAGDDGLDAHLAKQAESSKQDRLRKTVEQARRVRPAGSTVSAATARVATPHSDPHSVEAIFADPKFLELRRKRHERGSLV